MVTFLWPRSRVGPRSIVKSRRKNKQKAWERCGRSERKKDQHLTKTKTNTNISDKTLTQGTCHFVVGWVQRHCCYTSWCLQMTPSAPLGRTQKWEIPELTKWRGAEIVNSQWALTWLPPRPLHMTPASWNLTLWENPTSLCSPSPHSNGQEPFLSTASTPAPLWRSWRTSAPMGQSTRGCAATPEQLASWLISCGCNALPQTLPRVSSPLGVGS